MHEKPFSPACERNRAPILSVLRNAFSNATRVLEIGSGTGQHAVHFAAAMPQLIWQCSDDEAHLPGIRQWLDEAALPNTPAPFALQSVAGEGLQSPRDETMPRFDAVFSANTLHIMAWPEVQALFSSLPVWLHAEASTLAFYGPFNVGGEFTSESNREFDAWLKARDPRSGIRDLEAVVALAEAIGSHLREEVAMPANNRMLLFARKPVPASRAVAE